MGKEPKSQVKKAQKNVKTCTFSTVEGMADILPKDQDWWKLVWQLGYATSELHDFNFIETPLIEEAGMFEETAGVAKEFVEKHLFLLKTGEKEKIALSFCPKISVLRSYLEHRLAYFASPLKVFYILPVLKKIRMKEGNLRESHEWGFQIIGEGDPIYDGEIILAVSDFLKGLKLKQPMLKINSGGCRVCRPAFRQKIKTYYRNERERLCKTCERNLETNVFALLHCEETKCKELMAEAPIILDYLCQNCNNHFKSVLELVEDNDIAYEPDSHLLPVNDYGMRTTFECYVPELPFPIASGCRFDYLAEAFGARVTPSVNGTLNIERVIEAMKLQGLAPHPKMKPKVFFVVLGDQAKKGALRLMNKLRSSGVAVVEVVGKKTLKAQLKSAERMNISLALLLGQKEVFEGTVIVRDMTSGAQETILAEKIVEEVKKRMNK